MARKWSNLNLPGALHYVALKKGDEGLASMKYGNDHDWFLKLRRGQGPPS
jgi:hypothetical protein